MGINIKNERVEELARRLAMQTNQSITGAIEQALNGELRRLEIQDDYATRKARILAKGLRHRFGVVDNFYWLLERSTGFDRGGRALTIYQLSN